MTRVKLFKYVMLVLAILQGCNNRLEKKLTMAESLLGFKIEGGYRVVDNEEHIGMSDYLETLKLQFSDAAFAELIKKVKSSPGYKGITRFDGIDSEFIMLDSMLYNGDRVSIVIHLSEKTLKYTYFSQ